MIRYHTSTTYDEALLLAAAVRSVTQSFPAAVQHFGEKLNRMADSVAAKISDSVHVDPDFHRDCLWAARESVMECMGLIEIAFNRGLIDEAHKISIRSSLHDLNKTLRALIRETSELVSALARE